MTRSVTIALLSAFFAWSAGPVAGAGALFKETFDGKGLASGWSGKLQRRMRQGRGGGAVEAVPGGGKWFGLTVAPPPEYNKGLFTLGANTYLNFAYWVEKQTNIHVQVNYEGIGNTGYTVEPTVPQQWMVVSVALKNFSAKNKGAKRPAKGAKCKAFQFYAGRDKENFKFFIDSLFVTEGVPASFRKALLVQRKRLKKFTFTFSADQMLLNMGIIINLRKVYDPGKQTAKTLAIVGDRLAAAEKFGASMAGKGYRIVDREKTTAENMTAKQALDATRKVLAEENPGWLFLFVGFEQVQQIVGTREESLDDAATIGGSKSGEKPKPKTGLSSDKLLRKRIRPHIQALIKACLDNRTIPVIFTVPPIFKRKGVGWWSVPEFGAYNAVLVDAAVQAKVPVLDVASHVGNLKNKRRGSKTYVTTVIRDDKLHQVTGAGIRPELFTDINGMLTKKLFKALESEIVRKARRR